MSKIIGAAFTLFTVFIFSCGGAGSAESNKFQLYYAQGENIYATRCSNCHQATGEGLGLVYPPLNKSDYMEKHPDITVCVIKRGVRGSLLVNGEEYNQPMPGVPTLTDLEMAELLTYIYNTWGHKKGIIEVPFVASSLLKCQE